MNIAFKKSGPILVVILQGRLDASHHQDIRDVVGREIEATEAKGVVFDLAGLEYISSAGFREFFLLGRQLQRKGGGLAVCSLQPSVQQIFDIAQFQTAYPVCTTRDTSLAVAHGERLTLRVCPQSRLLSSRVGNSPPDSFLAPENSHPEN